MAQNHRDDVVTPFDLSARGGIVVDVQLDGRGPYRLLLDTGSTHSVLTQRVADAIGARPVAQALVSSAAGVRMAPVVAIGALMVGPVVARAMPSVVTSLPVPSEADGLLGQDVLAGQHYTIDLARRVIVWHTTACLPGVGSHAATLTMREVEGRFVVQARVGTRLLQLVLDTASEALVLFVRPEDQHMTRDRPAGGAPATLTTVSGRSEVSVGAARLRLGAVEQEKVEVVLVPRDVEVGQPEGLLPLHGFARATVDGPRRQLVLETDGSS